MPKRRKPVIDLEVLLSPEVDEWLGHATTEFNAKQEALSRNWSFDSYEEWGYSQETGIFTLDFVDGSQFHADGQLLGSHCASDGTWEWAWHNPNIKTTAAKDSHTVKQLGERLGIDYLQVGSIPCPDMGFAFYLAAIGIKATDSIGIFSGTSGSMSYLIMLKNPRK